MNQSEIDALYNANISQLNTMNIAAGSMVKTLLQSLEANGSVYLRLENPVEGGHRVGYSLIEGDSRIVTALADALGLGLSESTIEVPMIKKLAISSVSVAVCTMVALAYVTARFVDKEEILRAKNELEQLRTEHTALQTKVAKLTHEQSELKDDIKGKASEIERNKNTITTLKQQQEVQQLNVRMLRTQDEQLRSFFQAYPELSKAKNVGVTKMLVNEELNLTIDYLAVPLGFAETFVIEHNAKIKLQEQLDKYKQNEDLYGSVIDLKDKVLKLEETKTQAFQVGYDKAFTLYEGVNEKYVSCLEKPPKVEIKAPNKWLLLGCSAVGIAIGAGL
ncbi:hypothetical protein [Teredinibacter franksiae]|uniref:hypothetical protein n=1 Tax=Teredinibacter franksiae TaxID=2761453 RepID=UPI0016271A43|nr:hypothetical protein [Teredinibacter franksiae]